MSTRNCGGMPCALARSSVLTTAPSSADGQLDHRPDGVLRLGRHPHTANSAIDMGANRTRVHHHRQMTTRVACAQIPLSIGDTAGNRTTCTSRDRGGGPRRRADRRAARTGVVGLCLRRPRRTVLVGRNPRRPGHHRMGQSRRGVRAHHRRRIPRGGGRRDLQQRGRRRPDRSARRVSQGAPVGQRERRVRPRRRPAHRWWTPSTAASA